MQENDMYSRYKNLILEKGYTSYFIAKNTGISQAVFSDWKKGYSVPKLDKIQKIAELLGVTVDYLIGNSNERALKPQKKEGMVQMPLYTRLSCGNGGFVDDDIIDYISLPDSILNMSKDYFAHYAKGDSMIGANINDGDLLIFEKTQVIENGQIGCFCIDNNDATCKRYYKTDQALIMLQPSNEKYQPIAVTVENTCFRVLGKLALTINKTNY